jgi:NAD(P)-dependent dehydrogenase (short-subunit alcohol dehydrogenase family)
LFAENGANVQAIDRNLAGLTSLQAEIGAHKCHIFHNDVRNDEQVIEYMREIYENYNEINILCNIAGYEGDEHASPFHLRSLTEMRDVIDINLWSTVLNCRCVIPYMLETLQKKKNQGKNEQNENENENAECAIINTSSLTTNVAFAGASPYVISKYGINGLSNILAAEYGASGIRVNVVKPGYVMTGMVERALGKQNVQMEDVQALMKDVTPIGRIAAAKEIAQSFLFLADGQKSAFVNGTELLVDGGCSTTKFQLPSFLQEQEPKENY